MPRLNFELAPPPRRSGDLLAVPIDIRSVDATVTMDLSAGKAEAEATVKFAMGPQPGHPMFDLRQTIDAAWLDGGPIDSVKLAHHDLGGGEGAEMRVIGEGLAAGAEHAPRVRYGLGTPRSLESKAIAWNPLAGSVEWDLFLSDLRPARYLEQWFPANFIYDQFAFRLEIRLLNTTVEHGLVTNGAVVELGVNRWRVDFPERYTALSPMLILAPAGSIETLHSTAGGIRVETAQLPPAGIVLAEQQQRIHEYLEHYARFVGPYAHGERFTAYLWGNSRSMEYDGAVSSNAQALEHEVFHSWFARGVKPATQNDGWIDEAWTMWCTEENRFQAIPFDMSRPPLALAPSNPHNRATPVQSYEEGFRFFAGIASLMGVEPLLEAMFELYRTDPLRLLTTRELERHLGERANVTPYFRRFVYGLD